MGDVEFSKVAPVLTVVDLDAALDRYRRMGFAVRAYEGSARYGYADRDTVSLHLSESHHHDPEQSDAVVYLYVSDADALHAEWTAAGVEGRFRGPFDTTYGLREFGFVDPDGTLHRVGSPLAQGTPQ